MMQGVERQCGKRAGGGGKYKETEKAKKGNRFREMKEVSPGRVQRHDFKDYDYRGRNKQKSERRNRASSEKEEENP